MSGDTTDEELHDLMSHDAADTLRQLLAAGLDASHCSEADSSTLLHLAASLGAKKCLQALLEAGADPDAEDDFENTPLSECIRAYTYPESQTCARMLIEAGADVNHANDGIPLLCEATARGREEHLRLLLEAGADVNQRDWVGRSALHHAASSDNAAAIRMLLAAGADPTAKDRIGGSIARDCCEKSEECRALLDEALPARRITLKTRAATDVSAIYRPWQRRATLLRSSTGSAPPEAQVCWLGRVTRQRPGEPWPQDSEGKRLVPLATLFIGTMPEIPPALEKVALITLYAPQEPWSEQGPSLGCVIRSYATLEGLELCDRAATDFTPCLLSPELIEDDLPLFPDCGGDEELWAALHSIGQDEDSIEASAHTHKIGGYPTYLQSAPELPEGDEFVLQISSDATAGLSLGDSGTYYFYYNARQNRWRVHYDCY